MHPFDFSPLIRNAIGLERILRAAEHVRHQADGNSYPPYNIEKKDEDSYVLTLAVAGFAPEDLEIVTADETLTITGKAPAAEGDKRQYLYRGIAGRSFARRFALASHLVVHSASMNHGLLHVELKREVPEALKPRTIAINTASAAANDGGAPKSEAA